MNYNVVLSQCMLILAVLIGAPNNVKAVQPIIVSMETVKPAKTKKANLVCKNENMEEEIQDCKGRTNGFICSRISSDIVSRADAVFFSRNREYREYSAVVSFGWFIELYYF